MVTHVRLRGANADILLPPRGELETYAREIAAKGLFETAGELAKIPTTAVEPTNAPRVAIVVSDPHKLIPGADAETEDLIEQVKEMRCTPVLLPPCADVLIEPAVRHQTLLTLAQSLDGVLGPGGDDVDPQLYGEVRTPEVQTTHYQRDRFEADFALAARSQHLFMFGICRAHQLWNAAFGGALVQDVRVEGRSIMTQDQESLGIPLDQPFIVRWPDGSVRLEHRVHIAPQSWLSEALQMESMVTNSYHHQAVDVAGRGMRVVGVVRDVEANKDTIEVTEDWNIMTTQYHPELMQAVEEQRRLFSMLGRRAHVFWVLRGLRSQADVSLAALLSRLERLPSGILRDDDWAWAKTALAPRL